MSKINRYNYEVIYALNQITKNWLEEVNKNIKEKGLNETINCNEDNNIFIQERKAQPKYSEEDTKRLSDFKATLTIINKDEKIKCVNVAHLSKSTNDKIDKILTMLEENQDNKVIQRVAIMIKTKKK